MEKKIPMRTCIACKSVKPKKELIRVVKFGEEISLDKTGKKNGRGAYVCAEEACLKKLMGKKLLNRAFSANVDLDVYRGVEEDALGEK